MGGVAGAREQERLAVLVVRAWRSLDGDTVVARLTSSVDSTSADRVVLVAAGIEAILDAVRAWLTDVAGGDGS
jgi:hypothetical protein